MGILRIILFVFILCSPVFPILVVHQPLPSGAGDGDVLGPATNNDLYVPQWDGTNTKTLQDGFPISEQGKTWVNLSTTANMRDNIGLNNHQLITASASGIVVSGTVTANNANIISGLSVASSNAVSGQILATSARFGGTVTANALYVRDFACGEMFVSYNAVAMNIISAETYYTVTSNVVAGDLDDFTFTNSGTDCYLTVGKSGLYSFVGTLSFSGGNNDEFHGGLSVNNSAPEGCCEFDRRMGAAGDVGSAAFSGIRRLTAGNTIRVKIENETDADDPTVRVMNLQLVRIAP